MVITDRLDPVELARILHDSGLWETVAEVEAAAASREGFVIIAREGRHIDAAIGEYYLDDLGYIDDVPEPWAPYIDEERFGRDIRLDDAHGRAVDLIDDPSGLYGRDWRYYVIREV